jgi:hypothetical protein
MAIHDHHYKRISDEDIMDVLRSFQEEIPYFLHYVQGYPKDLQYRVCGLDLIDAIIRVDKRRVYFDVFHDMNINDCKKAALFAYWLVKFRPIKIIDERYENTLGHNDRVNEMFAIHYLLAILCAEGRLQVWDGSKGAHISMEHPYVNKLRYSFRFRNFTIDSMVVLASTISTETFLLAEEDEKTGSPKPV